METKMELDDCLNQFESVTAQIAPLHAVYGPGGTWILHRDRLKAKLFSEWFDTLTNDESNPKRIDVEQHVLTDPRWQEAIEEAERNREKLYLLYGQRQLFRWMIEGKLYKQSESVELEHANDFEAEK